MYLGCQCSSARCSRLLPDRLTLFGIFSAEIILGLAAKDTKALCPLSPWCPLWAHAQSQVRLQSNSGRPCCPYTLSAPFSPTAFGRWKIQFCHAVSRPKIFVSIVRSEERRV